MILSAASTDREAFIPFQEYEAHIRKMAEIAANAAVTIFFMANPPLTLTVPAYVL
jgi:hypothetical protein